jgi:hypothetical protein
MNMKKLTLALALSAAIATLSACGGGGGSDPNSTVPTSSTGMAGAPSSASSPAVTSGTGSTITTPSKPSGGYNGTASGGSSTGSGTSTPSSTTSVTAGSTSTPAQTPLNMNCSVAGTGAPTSSTLVTADTPSSDKTRLYPLNTAFTINLSAAPSAADTLNWSVFDTVGNAVATGSVPVVAGGNSVSLSCKSSLAGYFAVTASLSKAGGQVLQAGTRPNGFATFGVIPNMSGVLDTPVFSNFEQHRFGMQGFNDNGPMLAALGIKSTIDDRQQSVTEPNGPNTFNPSTYPLDQFYTSGDVMRIVRLDGIPAWASPTGAVSYGTLPSDLNQYQNYMARVGTNTEAIRSSYFKTQANNYYQVTWEPDVQWKSSDADFVTLYKTAYAGLHSTDPHAVVMGPTDALIGTTLTHLQKLAPLGFAQYIDGVATHGYYDAGTSPSHPPERRSTDSDPAVVASSLPNTVAALKAQMSSMKPGMKLFQTEVGISYDLGTSYGPNYPTPNVLFAQAAVVARTHIILLGEGVDQTYVFYGPDYNGEVGYGTFFDLSNPQGSFGTTNISPKPAAMAVSAMTHVLDGTKTLGPVKGIPTGVYGFAFQQLGGNKVITALWTHANSVWDASVGFSTTYQVPYTLTVDSPGTSGTVQVVDMMGNATAMPYSDGKIKLNLTEAPVYVVSNNPSVSAANATLPPQ